MEEEDPLAVIKEVSEELQNSESRKPTCSLFLVKGSEFVKEPLFF